MTLLLDDGAVARRSVYCLLIVLAAGTLLGRLMTVRSNRGGTPMLSANDRSRWSTIRALVDEGTYEIDRVIFRAPGKRDPEWDSIDKVRHRGPDGRQHYYSTKPTLLTTLLALPYWCLHRATGLSIAEKPFYVVRVTLVLVNILPFVGFLALLARYAERQGVSSWGKQFLVAAAAFGTPLTTFAVTLNNHSPAALFVLGATCAALRIGREAQSPLWVYVACGSCAAMAAACELPALSFLVLAAAAVGLKSPYRLLVGFLPPGLLVIAAALGTNYLAHGTWSTAYAHRQDGPVIARLNYAQFGELAAGPVRADLREQLAAAGVTLSGDATLAVRPLNRGFAVWDPSTETRYALQADANGVTLRQWNNWYEFEGSYWSSDRPQGVDRGEASRLVYAFHAMFGHHGLLSLTPIWLLSFAGGLVWVLQGDRTQRCLALATGLLTTVCLVFFILLRPLPDRNYGGVSCCFRWAIWLIPLWLMCLLPALDAMARRAWLRGSAWAMLLVCTFSATYNSQNPWSHPWLFDYWTHLGWINYAN